MPEFNAKISLQITLLRASRDALIQDLQENITTLLLIGNNYLNW